jgi:hypothetical protein
MPGLSFHFFFFFFFFFLKKTKKKKKIYSENTANTQVQGIKTSQNENEPKADQKITPLKQVNQQQEKSLLHKNKITTRPADQKIPKLRVKEAA